MLDYFRCFCRQLNATLELDKQRKILYQKKCFGNPIINGQRQTLNENHLIEKQIRHLVPGQLIIFGKLDKNNGQSENRLVVKTSGIIRWKPSVENFVWNNLGKWIFMCPWGEMENFSDCLCFWVCSARLFWGFNRYGGCEWCWAKGILNFTDEKAKITKIWRGIWVGNNGFNLWWKFCK